MDQHLTVVKSNELNEASYRLSLDEQRLILSCISQVNSMEKLKRGEYFVVSVKDFVENFGADKKSAYNQLKEVADKLYERSIIFKSNKYKKGYTKTRWVSSVNYRECEGAVAVEFAPQVVPHISRLESCFTKYKLEVVSKLTSAYAIRIYEILIQYRSSKKQFRNISVENLRHMLGIQQKEYTRMSDFKRYVLEIAEKQINDKTDMNLKIEYVKSGRKITGFIFKFKEKEHLNRKVSGKKAADTFRDMRKFLNTPTRELPLN